MEEALILGYNVERLRKATGMDIATFARVAGVTRPTVYKVESGKSDLKLSYLRRLADALDVTITELLEPPEESELAARRYCELSHIIGNATPYRKF